MNVEKNESCKKGSKTNSYVIGMVEDRDSADINVVGTNVSGDDVKPVIEMPVKGTPFKHQVEGFNFVCGLFGLAESYGAELQNPSHPEASTGAALLCEMGLGKGFIAVAVTGALFQRDLISKVLVACPLSIFGVWSSEFPKFAKYGVKVTVLRDSFTKKKKIALIEEARRKADGVNAKGTAMAGIANANGGAKTGDAPLQVIVVNYESAWRLVKELTAFGPDLIIADEGHKIKNALSKRSKGMHDLGDKAAYRLLLTGTLITNKELDVYSQYRFVAPAVFGKNFYTFRNHFFYMGGYENHQPFFRKSMTDEFEQKLHSIAFRRTKDECLDLPEKTEELRKVDLEPQALKVYKEIEKDSYAELDRIRRGYKGIEDDDRLDTDPHEITAANVLTRILRLSQITGGYVGDDEGDVHQVSKAKMDALFDIIDSVMADGRKLVIMCRFVPEMDGIEKELEKRRIQFSHVRGGVADRDEEVRRFQEDPDVAVFVGQIAAAGVGLTLTAASTMVFYSLDYDMSNFQQAKDRILRIGQTENCHYIYLIAENTIDGKVMKSLQDKVSLARMLIDECRAGLNPFEAM